MAKNKTGAITPENAAKEMLKHPEKIGVMVGFKDLTRLHGKWIREIVFGTKDYTLQAHRGSYKSSSLAVAIALIMILRDLILSETGIWSSSYHESQNKRLKILTYLRQCWPRIKFLPGTDPAYIRQIMDFTETAEHDDAPDSAATICRFFTTYRWEGKS